MSNPTCSDEGCNTKPRVRGLCQRHYWNAWYNDDIEIAHRTGTFEERFWDRVDKTPTCWVWTGGVMSGRHQYGRVHVGAAKYRPAHRVAYEMLVGPIPEGLDLDHLCRNRVCVNPAHLEPVTNHENILRGTGPTAINARKTHCKRGHPLNGDNLVALRNSNERKCRICHRARVAAYDRKRRAKA
jgi:hypothetical protein